MRVLFLFFALIFSLKSAAQDIALVGAMPEEIKLLTESLKNKKVIQKAGITFYKGTLEGKKVVVFKSGIGKVNAAYATTILLENFPIKQVIFTGVAGGLHPDSYPGDLVIAEQVFHHDYVQHTADDYIVRATVNLMSNQPNPLYFRSDSVLFELAKKVSQNIELTQVGYRKPRVFYGTIATSDAFVSNSKKAKWLYENFNAFATEMEGAALGQICHQRGVPFLIIRSCSDNANNQAHLDFSTFVEPAAENAIQLVMRILRGMD